MEFVQNIVHRTQGLRYGDLTATTRDDIRALVIAVVGAMLAGNQEIPQKILLKSLNIGCKAGASVIVGAENGASILDATFVNAAAAGDLPRAPLVSVSLAMAEERRASGRDFMLALAAALDARAVTVSETIGGAIAAAKLAGLSPDKTADVLHLALSLSERASGQRSTLNAANAARDALLAVTLVRDGYPIDPAMRIGGLASSEVQAEQRRSGSTDGISVSDQFTARAGKVLSMSAALVLLDRLECIEDVSDMSSVTALLSVASPSVHKPPSPIDVPMQETADSIWVP